MQQHNRHTSSLFLDHFAFILLGRMLSIGWLVPRTALKESHTALSSSNKYKKQTFLFPERTIWKINYLPLITQDSICLWYPFGGERQSKMKQLTCKKKLHSDVREFRLKSFQDKRWVIHFHTNMWGETKKVDIIKS